MLGVGFVFCFLHVSCMCRAPSGNAPVRLKADPWAELLNKRQWTPRRLSCFFFFSKEESLKCHAAPPTPPTC